jgi:hypothetical protein
MKNQGEKSLSQGWQAQWPALRRGEKSLPTSLYKREAVTGKSRGWPALRRGEKSLPTSLYKREEFGKGKGGVKAYPLATLSRWGFDGRA